MEYEEYIEISACDRLGDVGIHYKGGYYKFDNQRATLMPGAHRCVSYDLRVAHDCLHRDDVLYGCSCITSKPKMLTYKDSAALISRHISETKVDATRWANLISVVLRSSYAGLADYHLMFAINRSAYLITKITELIKDEDKLSNGEYSSNTLYSSYGYLCNKAGCLCEACMYMGGRVEDHWVLSNWVYLKSVLIEKTADNRLGIPLHELVDPWSLRRLWYCRICCDHNIVDALDNKQRLYQICLVCRTFMVVDEYKDGIRSYKNIEPILPLYRASRDYIVRQ